MMGQDLTGMCFTRLTVLKLAYKNTHKESYWRCRCVCGRLRIIRGSSLKRGVSKSCGCLAKESWLKRITCHGESRNIMISREYQLWRNINKRCYEKTNISYPFYGGRGIKVYPLWRKSYTAFRNYLLDSIGRRPSEKHSLDRLDNNGNYEPKNLRWATAKDQAGNRRSRQKGGV